MENTEDNTKKNNNLKSKIINWSVGLGFLAAICSIGYVVESSQRESKRREQIKQAFEQYSVEQSYREVGINYNAKEPRDLTKDEADRIERYMKK